MAGAALLLLLLTAFITDIRSLRIPNWLTMSGIVTGLAFHGAAGGGAGLLASASGLAAGFGALLLLYIAKAVGAGDVKLFASIGAWGGTEFVLYSAIYSVLFAGFAALIYIWVGRKRVLGGDRTRFPFMLAAAPGVAAVWASGILPLA